MLNYSPSLDGVFHSLADPTRREIVERLTRKSASVKELAEPFDMSLPAVMLHLKILEASGIVTSRKEGRVRTVSINLEPLLMVDSWMNERKKTWSRLFDQLEEMLEEEEETVGVHKLHTTFLRLSARFERPARELIGPGPISTRRQNGS